MSKWYMAKVTAVSMVLVEVEEEETEMLTAAAAIDAVMEEKATSDGDVEVCIEDGPYEKGDADWVQAKRHADEVLKL
jgi:hypothetical protein